MAFSKETRIKIFIIIDVIFFLIEIIIGYAAHSLALVADAFHMLNDVISLFVGLWAVRVATHWSSDNNYTYGWARAELIGGLTNGVFLVALCLSIFLDAIQRFVEPQEVRNPQVVLVVGGIGLAFNILGLFVFHQHSHGHDEESEEHKHLPNNELNSVENGHGPQQPQPSINNTPPPKRNGLSPSIAWRVDGSLKPDSRPRSVSRRGQSASSNRRRSRARSTLEDLPTHPASLRNEFRKSARMAETGAEESSDDELVPSEDQTHTERSPLLRVDHTNHRHSQPKEQSAGGHGHSHADMNIRGLFLHVLGDALGNIGVMISALVIWQTSSPARFYADPAISLVITLIILKTALPMCKDTAKPLLQATPDNISIDAIREDVERLDGVRSCHHLHVWALTPSKPIATLDIELTFDFQGENAARYMQLAKEIKACLHGHGIHSSTIQPEFCLDPDHKDLSLLKLDGSASDASATTVQTAIANGTNESTRGQSSGSTSPQEHAACLLNCDDTCVTGKQCCGPSPMPGSTSTRKHTD